MCRRTFSGRSGRPAEVGASNLAWSTTAVSHPVGKEVRVDLPEERPVRETEVRQLLIAERLPQEVHVTGDVRGGHVVQDRLITVLARPGDGVVGLPPDLLLVLPHREGERSPGGGGFGEAVEAQQWCAADDAARVEADHVEVVGQLGGQNRRDGSDDVHA